MQVSRYYCGQPNDINLQFGDGLKTSHGESLGDGFLLALPIYFNDFPSKKLQNTSSSGMSHGIAPRIIARWRWKHWWCWARSIVCHQCLPGRSLRWRSEKKGVQHLWGMRFAFWVVIRYLCIVSYISHIHVSIITTSLPLSWSIRARTHILILWANTNTHSHKLTHTYIYV